LSATNTNEQSTLKIKINCNGERVGMLLTEIWETCNTNQRHETGRLKYTRTEENMITEDETTKVRNKHIVQYARYPKKQI